jgi:hypothetical protein
MQAAGAIIVFLLILAAAAWFFRSKSPAKTPDTEADPAFIETGSGAPEGGTPAAPPEPPGDDPATQDTGGGPPVKPK